MAESSTEYTLPVSQSNLFQKTVLLVATSFTLTNKYQVLPESKPTAFHAFLNLQRKGCTKMEGEIYLCKCGIQINAVSEKKVADKNSRLHP